MPKQNRNEIEIRIIRFASIILLILMLIKLLIHELKSW